MVWGGVRGAFLKYIYPLPPKNKTAGKTTAERGAAVVVGGAFVPYSQYAHEDGSKRKGRQQQARSFSELELYKARGDVKEGTRRRGWALALTEPGASPPPRLF